MGDMIGKGRSYWDFHEEVSPRPQIALWFTALGEHNSPIAF